jgi:hypothetical protein
VAAESGIHFTNEVVPGFSTWTSSANGLEGGALAHITWNGVFTVAVAGAVSGTLTVDVLVEAVSFTE